MKHILSALLVMGIALATAPSRAADNRNVSVVNETGYAIKFLGFNGPDDGLDEWENELEETLKNQDTAYVEFGADDEGCVWNIKVDFTTPAPRPPRSSRSNGPRPAKAGNHGAAGSAAPLTVPGLTQPAMRQANWIGGRQPLVSQWVYPSG
ncbi:hypothetical protein [Bradyrhizobium genosp. L]|uniref:hypothetical protein n=1 Tax=Bradyrhizobium genosp. L TaxID=83637 RepID=UPI001FED8917|nr:hypothetical protein [Bradyrhizobium genosp. L]